MQRIRISLPYYATFGWEAEVVTVKPSYVDMVKDEMLNHSIPSNIKIHEIDALSKKWTSKFGLGSIALRSLIYYKRKVDQLLKKEKFDLIYFSTTQFPVAILGNYWKKKFHVPYVIDMQDPWHSEYYQDKPKNERPKKYWFSYRLNKYLEPIAMRNVDGLISVSETYLDTLKLRYPKLKQIPSPVITFGASAEDFEIAKSNATMSNLLHMDRSQINLIYIGRGGHDMTEAITLLFQSFKGNKDKNLQKYQHIHFYFIGTSYAKHGEGIKTIWPIAVKMGIENHVTEITDRLPYFETLNIISNADGLIVTGSNSVGYNASKLYPYILANRPLLGIFHQRSSSAKIINQTRAGQLITFDRNDNDSIKVFENFIDQVKSGEVPQTDWENFEQYTAKALTAKQVELFEKVIDNFKKSR